MSDQRRALRRSVVKAKLARREPVAARLDRDSRSGVELGSRYGFDAIWLDVEHGSTTLTTIAVLRLRRGFRAARLHVRTRLTMRRCRLGGLL
jgi:2-keto-3-deoxy-L-rhamnonate aldolase RhmA